MQTQLADLSMFWLGQNEHDSSGHEHSARDIAPYCGFLGAESGVIGADAYFIALGGIGAANGRTAIGRSRIFLGVGPQHEKGPDSYADNAQRCDPNADILLSKEAAF